MRAISRVISTVTIRVISTVIIRVISTFIIRVVSTLNLQVGLLLASGRFRAFQVSWGPSKARSPPKPKPPKI